MAVIPALIPICFFLSERLSAVTVALFGAKLFIPILCFSAIICTIGGCIAYRLKIKNIIYLACITVGIPVGLLTADITCAEALLSKIGAGILLCFYLCILGNVMSKIHLRKISKTALVFSVVMLVVSNISAWLYARSCEYIYYWDNAIYWTFARDIAGGSIKNNFLTCLYDSILTFDYNYLAALLPALFARIFGTSRTVYIFAVVNCCFLPCTLAVYTLVKDTIKSCVILLALPILIFLALTGFVDVIGFAVCLLCYAFYKDNRNSPIIGFAIGALLALAILTRRWYAFFAVSFIFAMLIDGFICGKNYKCFFSALLNTGFILMMIFSPLVINKLFADYSTAYSGYKFSLMTDIKLFARYFGILPIFTALIGTICCIIKKDKRVIMPVIQMITCFLIFIRTQTHGQQHLLLYVPAMAVILGYLLEKINSKTLAITVVCSICISANTLIDRPQPQSLSEINHLALLPDFSMRGRKRNDAQQILQLKNQLDARYSDGLLGINASSFIVNADILKNVQPSLGAKEYDSNYIKELPCVDSRDKDLSRFYDMDYILTSNPIQIHLSPEKQTVVALADDCLKNSIAFGKAYKKDDFSYIINGIEFSVYKKIRNVNDDEKSETEKYIWK